MYIAMLKAGESVLLPGGVGFKRDHNENIFTWGDTSEYSVGHADGEVVIYACPHGCMLIMDERKIQ